MKKTNKKLWIRALRSGKYKQGVGFLCRDNEFCCLGVAYDVLIDGEWVDDSYCERENWGINAASKLEQSYVDTAFPPDHILEKIELSKSDADKLARMNDRGTSFGKIADWIEKNVKVT